MHRTSIILKNAREDKDLSIAEVSKKLKISAKYLEAIENEQKSCFPAEPYCSLIIKDYAFFLGLNGDDILSLFRRDFSTKSAKKPSSVSGLSLTPQKIFFLAISITIFLFVGYMGMEYLRYNQSPPLQVIWPEDSELTNSAKIEISGITDPESTIRVNSDLIIVDQNGNFKKVVTLNSPESKITVESRSHNGKSTIVEKTYHPK